MTFNQAEYMKKRYHSDPEFRQRVINAVIKYQKKNQIKVNMNQRLYYKNRTPVQIELRKNYLKKLKEYNIKNNIKGYGNP